MCYNQLYGLYNYTHTHIFQVIFFHIGAGGETVKIKMIYLASSSLLLEYLTQFYNMPGIFLSTSVLLIHSIF